MFASLCGAYPFPEDERYVKSFRSYPLQKGSEDGNIEYMHKLPVKCLPRLLREIGYKTAAMQSTEMGFDHQMDLIVQMGFEDRVSKEIIDRRYPENDFEELPYFGYADQYAKPLVLEWVNKVKDQPFMTFLTATTHHPYLTPASWKRKQFTQFLDDEFNSYLNTLNYVDVFLRDLFEEFKKSGIMNDTIFVFTGDHGLSLRDHDQVYDVHAVPYEEAFRVPIIMYTENEKWKNKLKGRRSDEEQWTNLDLLPTILDILTPTPRILQLLSKAGYEGRSILDPYSEIPKYSHGNPGDHTVSFLYQGKKIIRQTDDSDIIFDLANDPHEDHPVLPNEQLPLNLWQWYLEGVSALETHLRHVHEKWGVRWSKKQKMWPYYNTTVYCLAAGLFLFYLYSSRRSANIQAFILDVLFDKVAFEDTHVI